MKIRVVVKPNSKKEKVEEENGGFKVFVNAPPADGRANKRVVEMLAEYLGCSRSRIRLAQGKKGKQKIFEVV